MHYFRIPASGSGAVVGTTLADNQLRKYVGASAKIMYIESHRIVPALCYSFYTIIIATILGNDNGLTYDQSL